MKATKFTVCQLIIMTLLLTPSCKDAYDDSELTGRVENLENRVQKLEEQMNSNISSLQAILEALNNNDYVTKVVPITNGEKEIGYTINFSKGTSINIYHGQDGQNGQDGYTPQIGVKLDIDGIYYWTLDGEWMTDDSGNKIKAQGIDGQNGQDGEDGAPGQDGKPGEDGQDGTPGKDGQDGKDGITPKFKIESDYWWVSYDNGTNWTQLGKATGEDGIDGDSMFTNIDTESSEDYVIFTLSNGTQIKLPTWSAFETLKILCNQMNTNIESMQGILEALQNNDYITSITPIMEDSKEIGYTIYFKKGNPITIYHGQDGQNGQDGKPGEDGQNGQDGYTPQIGVKQDIDGIYYWTLDGEWMTDENGNKIKAQGIDGQNGQDGTPGEDGQDGQDGITPQFKIEDKYWWVSYNNGANWEKLGQATGEDATSIFKEVTQDEDFIHFKMQDDTVISVPKHHPLSISFSETEDIRVLPNKTYTINYTITGSDENTVIKALAQDGFRAVVKETDHSQGIIEITTPTTVLSSEILVFVTDGKERTIMRSINFVEGVIIISTKNYTVDSNGGPVDIDLSTNINYTVEIPEEDKSWISITNTKSRVTMRDETVTLMVQPNENAVYRYSTIEFIDEQGVTGETILITQKSGTSRVINVEMPGTLETIMTEDEKNNTEDLKITGTLNSFDFEFIKTMPILNTLDLRDIQNESLPASCLAETKISTVILPVALKKISSRAFYMSSITSINFPETLEEIGDYAFAETQSLTGRIVIPDKVVTIGNNAFQNSYFNGTLHIGESVQTIGEYAFCGCKGTGDIIIPDNVVTLGKYAFSECSEFTGNLIIGNNVGIIEERTFNECTGLSGTLKLGNSITSINEYAFYGCSSLTGNVDLPESVINIQEYAFYGCISFKGYLKLGPNVKKILSHSFVSSNSSYRSEKLNFSKVYCMATVIPGITDFTFGYGSNWPTHLLVPTGCKTKYETASRWNNFTTIEETEF